MRERRRIAEYNILILTPEAKIENGSRGLIASLRGKNKIKKSTLLWEPRLGYLTLSPAYNSPMNFAFMTFELLNGILFLLIPEGTRGVSTGRQQLLVWAKEDAVCDELGVLCNALPWHGDLSDRTITTHSIIDFIDAALIIQTTVCVCVCVFVQTGNVHSPQTLQDILRTNKNHLTHKPQVWWMGSRNRPVPTG